MKRPERLLVPVIIIGILVLPGCDPAPGTAAYNSMLRRPLAAQVTGGLASAPILGTSFQGEKIPADKAVVYIYRPAGSTGGKAMPFGVRVSDKVVTTQVQGGYYAYLTEPGNIEFTVFEIGLMAPKSTSSITVDAKAGLAYYLKGSHGKGAGGRAHLELVSPEVGANEIVNCKVITTQ